MLLFSKECIRHTYIEGYFLCVLYFRNLSLGAKAEIAMDKHVTYLNMDTRQELIMLLNGTRNKAV